MSYFQECCHSFPWKSVFAMSRAILYFLANIVFYTEMLLEFILWSTFVFLFVHLPRTELRTVYWWEPNEFWWIIRRINLINDFLNFFVFSYLRDTDSSLVSHSSNDILGVILNGDKRFNPCTNKRILTTIIKYFKNTQRFDQALFGTYESYPFHQFFSFLSFSLFIYLLVFHKH